MATPFETIAPAKHLPRQLINTEDINRLAPSVGGQTHAQSRAQTASASLHCNAEMRRAEKKKIISKIGQFPILLRGYLPRTPSLFLRKRMWL
jgi:hypothetical protein